VSGSAFAHAPVFGSSTPSAYAVARAVEYGGTALLVGGLVFIALVWPAGADSRGARRVLVTGWAVGTLATVAALGLGGSWATGGSIGDAAKRSVLEAVLQTDFGREWAVLVLLQILMLVVLADLLRRGAAVARSLPWRVGALAVGLGLLRVYGLTGHSRETAHPLVAQLADLAHLTAMAVWIGGLTMLLGGVLPRRQPRELGTVLPRYSMLALGSVGIVVVSGALMAWGLLGSLDDLTSTTYGHFLLVKIAVLALVLAAAGSSKTWVEHRLDFVVLLRGEGSITANPAGLVRPVVLSVAVETGLLALVLVVASFLVTADPGR
jgi:copper transport protein